MLCRTLNLGILAHVDAGKTTLTERLLYAAGVIDALGSVDQGTTQTDSLALERQRGITIKSAVVSFAIDDVDVNLIDTPGHPDFIAEVERVLSVLDGAVLVVSAVEGVQPQTRVLMRALQRLRVPTLIFVNKIDRRGADPEAVFEALSARLAPVPVAMGSVRDPGSRTAGFTPFGASDAAFTTSLTAALAEHDDALLAAYLDETEVPYRRLRAELAAQTGRALLQPVFFGSAKTGAGVAELTGGIAALLPAATGDASGPVAGTVFKIERGAGGEKVAFVRMFSGTLQTRDRLPGGDGGRSKVTAIRVFEQGAAVQRGSVRAGEIAKLWGLAGARIGDAIGAPRADGGRQFAPPTLEAVVVPRRRGDRAALRLALAQLAEQDPLIAVRQDDRRGELSVLLYGEVQKEVLAATLAADYGIEVGFRQTTPIYIERPLASGEALEVLHAPSNPYNATLGLRVEPASAGSGVEFAVAVDPRAVPIYLYKTHERFREQMADYVRAALREGLHGWQVSDCVVTLTTCIHSVPDGSPSQRGPLSTAADFRKLTPIVVMEALERAQTVVCEPTLKLQLEVPADALGAVLAALGRLAAEIEPPSAQAGLGRIEAVVAATRADVLQRELPRMTGGEGVLESQFAGYRPVVGEQPARARTTASPLNLDEYLAELAGYHTSRA